MKIFLSPTWCMDFMRIAETISYSAHYSTQFMEELGKLLILAALAVVPVANIIVLGYLARVMASQPENTDLPGIEGWLEMFLQGLNLMIISLCYLSAGIVITVVLFYLGSLALSLIGWIIFLLGLIVLPIAWMHSVRRGEVSGGFDFRAIFEKISSIGWIDYLLWLIVVLILSGGLFALLVLIPIIGWFITLLISPAVGVFVSRSIALVYSERIGPPPRNF